MPLLCFRHSVDNQRPSVCRPITPEPITSSEAREESKLSSGKGFPTECLAGCFTWGSNILLGVALLDCWAHIPGLKRLSQQGWGQVEGFYMLAKLNSYLALLQGELGGRKQRGSKSPMHTSNKNGERLRTQWKKPS